MVKVSHAGTVPISVEVLVLNDPAARHLPRLTTGLCRPLRDLWEQDVSLGLANPWQGVC